jgi:AAA15 family ATPase/GTPase
MNQKSNDFFIKEVLIENFKSIKKINFKTKRINLFIGKPNVGKSNILEAFVLPAASGNYENTKVDDLIRFKEINDLFYFKNYRENVIVQLDNTLSIGRKQDNNFRFKILNKKNIKDSTQNLSSFNDDNLFPLDMDFELDGFLKNKPSIQDIIQFYKGSNISNNNNPQIIKFYKYKELDNYIESKYDYLIAPYGYNLLKVITENKDLKKLFTRYFEEYNLKLIINSESGEIKLLRTIDSTFDEIPYKLVADTLKRMLFYVTAIESNSNSIILLEEPEANCYPTFVSDFAKRIVQKEDNQYFIATHSPIFISEILDEDKKNETAIHIVYYQDDQTKIKTLNDSELEDIESLGFDVFFNEAHFLNEKV